MSEVHRVSVDVGGTEITFETGRLAKQASGSVVVSAGETMVLGTATAGNPRDVDFLPLTVDVEERMYSAGKIPGSFFKREGRSGEKGTLVARMIDRPLRPLFPKGWHRETQLVSIPLSIDHVVPYDILAMNGASAALMVSNIPFPEPVGAVRIGKIDGNFVVNPRGGSPHGRPRPRGLRHRRGHPDGRGRRQRDPRGRDPRCARHRALGDQEALRRDARARREGRQVAEARGRDAAGRRRPPRADQELARRQAGRGDLGAGQARPPGRHEGRRGGDPRAVLRRPRGSPSTARTAPRRSSRSTSSRSRSSASASPSTRSARTAARDGRDPRDHDRGRPAAAHARLRAVHARPDPGDLSGRPGHHARGDAARHARPRRPPSATSTTTTSRPSRSGRRASCAAPSAATSATARSPSGRWCR